MMAPWVGGTHVNRVKKGDANTGDPLMPVAVEQQRAALKFIIETAFRDEPIYEEANARKLNGEKS